MADVLALALVRGSSVAAAARSAACSEKTARRRLAEKDFAERVDQLRVELLSETTHSLNAASVAAVGALKRLLKDESASARLGAARTILELSSRLRADLETERRLRSIEDKLAGLTK